MLNKNKLSRCNVELSEIGFGGAPLGNLYHKLDNKAALQCIEKAIDEGVNYFDTAPLYGHGLSERRIGLALGQAPREQCVVSSKVGRLLTPARRDEVADAGLYQQAPPFHAEFDYSYDGAWRSVEQSLQRIGSNYLDIVFIHDIDQWTHAEQQTKRYAQALNGCNKALIEMREQGIISAFGLGVNEWSVCQQFLHDSDPDCFLLAGRYTLLEQEALDSFLPACEKKSVDLIIGGPYNTGILATGACDGAYYNYRPADSEILKKVRQIEHLCADYGIPLAAAALRFPLAHPAVRSVIPGARTAVVVESNIALSKVNIPDGFWRDMKAQGFIHPDAPTLCSSNLSSPINNDRLGNETSEVER